MISVNKGCHCGLCHIVGLPEITWPQKLYDISKQGVSLQAVTLLAARRSHGHRNFMISVNKGCHCGLCHIVGLPEITWPQKLYDISKQGVSLQALSHCWLPGDHMATETV